MLETVSFPLVYSDSTFDQHIHKLDRVMAIKQRIQERKKKLEVIDGNHEVICQIANDVLEGPKKIDLTQKIETIKQRVKNRQDKLLNVEHEHKITLQIADNAIMQVEKEIQNTQHIEQEQKDIRQQMLIVHHDLKAVEKASILKQEQIKISDNLDLMQKILQEAFSNISLQLPRLDKVFLEIDQVKFNHEEIDKRFEDLSKQSQMIQIDQTRLAIKLDVLNQSSPSYNAIDSIVNAKILQTPVVKEKLKKSLDKHHVFQLAPHIAIDPSCEKFNESFEKIKNNTKSISSYIWTNLTSIASKTVSCIAWAALEADQFQKKIVSTLIQWVWSYGKPS